MGRLDFAYRRGCRFATILVNLESRRVVDLLADRGAATAAAWMRQQVDLWLSAETRVGEYVSASAQGAPQATEVGRSAVFGVEPFL